MAFKRIIIIFIGVFLLANQVFAATINVASPYAPANVATAIAAANSEGGDTVLLPLNETLTWSTSVTIDRPVTIDLNGTKLIQGAVLTNGFFYIAGVESDVLLRITNGEMDIVDFTTDRCAISFNTSTTDLGSLRIDNNKFYYGYTQIADTGRCYGVIDHNYFYNSLKAISFTAGDRADADLSWLDPSPGTANALFIEDNHFIEDADFPGTGTQERIGTYNGGKIVVRYNVFDSTEIAGVTATVTAFMAHGSAAGGCGTAGGYWQNVTDSCRRGQSVIEFHDNIISGPRVDFLFTSRGSVNLVYNNHLNGTVSNAPRIYFYEEEFYETSNWSVLRTAWPAEDQVHNTFIWGNTYPDTNTPYFNQASHIAIGPSNQNCLKAGYPMLCCTGASTGTCGDGTGQDTNPFIQLNRDYFLHAPLAAGTGTDGKESFIGEKGASDTFPTDGVSPHVAFTSGSEEPAVSDVLVGAISGATATVSRVQSIYYQKTFSTSTEVNVDTDTITLTNALSTTPAWAADTPVTVNTTSTLPSPLVVDTTYYIKNPSGYTTQLATTPGGDAIDLTSTGAGTRKLKSNTWELGNALGYLGFSSQTGDFQSENLNIQGGTSNVLTIASNTQIYPTEGNMEFDADVDNAYLAYVPYGVLIGDRYYHPLQDTTIPTKVSFIVDASGAFCTFKGNESLSITTGGGYTLSSDGPAVTLSYASHSGTDIILTASRTILSTESLTFSYTGTDTTDLFGNELGAITDEAVTNSSTQSGAVTSQTVYGVTGSTVFSGAGSTIYQ